MQNNKTTSDFNKKRKLEENENEFHFPLHPNDSKDEENNESLQSDETITFSIPIEQGKNLFLKN